MKKIAIILALALSLGSNVMSAKEKEKATAVFTVSPAITCQNCVNKIKTNLRFEKGVNDINADIKTQKVTIVYDPAKTNKEKLVEAFKKIGYSAEAKE